MSFYGLRNAILVIIMKTNYTKTKVLINFILVNLIINAFFYYVGFKGFEGTLTLKETQGDLLFGLVLLGIFCSYTGFVNTRKDLTTGHIPLDEHKFARLHQYLPKSYVMRSLCLTFFVVLVIFPLFSFLPRVLGVNEINHLIGFMNKTVSAALSAAIIGYLVISLSIEDYRSMLA